jgi:hypothetical protein
MYSSSNIRVIKLRRMRWSGYKALIVEMRNAYKMLVRKPKGKRPLGRPKHRWENDIKMDLKEIE